MRRAGSGSSGCSAVPLLVGSAAIEGLRRRLRRAGRALARGVGVLAAALAVGAAASAWAESVEVRTIAQAQFVESASETLPPDDAPWTSRPLPDRVVREGKAEPAVLWYRLALPDIGRDAAGAPLMLYMQRLDCATRVFLNGSLVTTLESPARTSYVRWMRPHLVVLPEAMLRDGGNVVHIRGLCWERVTGLGQVLAGPDRALRPVYEERFFWQITAAQISTVFGCLAGGFMLLVWWRRRKEVEYGLFGAAAVAWALRSVTFVVESVPADLWLYWRAYYYATTGAVLIFLSLFFLRLAGKRWPRVEAALIAYGIAGPLALLLAGRIVDPALAAWWIGSFLAIIPAALAVLGAAALRERRTEQIAVVAAAGFALALAFHDFLLDRGVITFGRPFALHLGVPIMLLAMAWAMTNRFVGTLAVAENVNVELARRIREKEAELASNFARLAEFERRQAVAQERERILQDMHDGLGSQLVSSLSMVERGVAGPREVATLLRECLDDMRLAVDSLASEPESFLAALGALRYRMEPRFAAVGVRFAWRVPEDGLTDTIPAAARLQLLRIVQESLTNALRHADAQEVSVAVSVDDEAGAAALRIRVEDDGKGLPENGAARAPGRGLRNMQTRARRIGARIEFVRRDRGTRIEVRLPLAAQPA
jgi:signal transduction histidine kinase